MPLWEPGAYWRIGYARAQSANRLELPNTCKRSLCSCIQLRRSAQRIKELRDEAVEGHQTAEAESSGDNAPASVTDHCGHGEHNRYGSPDGEPDPGLEEREMGTGCLGQKSKGLSFL